jgi:hypothetical protein
MWIGRKEKIIELLKKLEEDVKKESKDIPIVDYKLPSLQLWTAYQCYLHAILINFEPKTPEEYKTLEKIVTCLKLDDFYINAGEDFFENKIKLLDYINSIKEKINTKECSN